MVGYDPNKNVFEIRDCRGIKISCSEETWYGKILPARPYMEERIQDVIKAIEKPHFICSDSKKKNRNVYYLLQKTGSKKYLKIVIEIDSSKKGFMISAFPTDSGKVGEKIIWMP